MDAAMGAMGLGIILTLKDQASAGLDKIRQKVAGLEGVTKDMLKGFNTASKSFLSGVAMMWGGAKTLGAFNSVFGAPIETAANFEQAIAGVAAVSGATGKDFERLSAQAKQLGRDTQFSASQAANAQELLARAGFDTNEIIKSMPDVLNMAAAEGMELANAADIAASTLRSFGLEASEMSRVSNVLAATSAKTNTSISTLGESFKYSAPFARALGIEIEDAAAMIGAMGDAGIKGSMAGTSLASALRRLATEPKQAREALASLGIAAKDSLENGAVSIEKLMKLINAKISGLDKLEQEKILSRIFGGEAGAGMLGVMNAVVSGKLSQKRDEITAATTAAQDMATRMNATYQGATKRLESASEGLRIAIGNIFLPVLTWLIDKIAAIKSAITGFIETFPLLSKVVISGVGAVAALVAAFLTLNGAIMAAHGALKLLPLAQKAFGSGLGKFIQTPLGIGIDYFKLAREEGYGLAKSFSFAASSLKGDFLNVLKAIPGPIKVLIALAGLLFAAYKTNFGGFRDMVTSISEGWKMAMSANAGGIAEIDSDTAERLKKAGIWDSTVNMGKVFWRVREFFTGFKEGALEAINFVVAGFKKVGDIFAPLITGGTAFLRILGILNPVADSSASTWKEVGRRVGIATTAVIGLYGVYKTLRILTAGWAAAQWTLNLAQQAGSGLWSAGKLVLIAAKTGIVTAATWAWSAAQWALSIAMNAGLLPILGIIAAVAALVAAGYWLYNNWDTVCDALVAAWNWVWDVLITEWKFKLSLIAQGWEWLKSHLIPDWLVGFWNILVVGWNKFVKIIKSGWGKFKSIFTLKTLSNIWSALVTGWDNAKNWVLQGWEALKSWFANSWLGKVWDGLVSGWNYVKDLIKQGWQNFKSLFTLENLEKAWDFLVFGWENTKASLSQAWQDFKGLFTLENLEKAWDVLVDGFNGAKDLITQGWEKLKDIFSFEWLSETFEKLKSGFSDLMNFIGDLWNKSIGKLIDFAGGLIGGLIDKVKGLWNGALNLVGLGGEDEGQMIAVQVQDITMLNKMYEGFRDRVNEMSAAWTPFKTSLGEGFENIYNVMKNTGANIRSSVIPAVNELVTALHQLSFELENVARAGGVNVQVPQSQAARQQEVTNHVMKWGSGFAAHAAGGLFTTPHLGLVAEAGPEAIIPLSDPSRGVPILNAAADVLGVMPETENGTSAAILSSLSRTARQSSSGGDYERTVTRKEKTQAPENKVSVNLDAVTTPVYLDGDMIGQFMIRFFEHQGMRNGDPALA